MQRICEVWNQNNFNKFNSFKAKYEDLLKLKVFFKRFVWQKDACNSLILMTRDCSDLGGQLNSFTPRKIFITFIWFMLFTIITGNTIYPIKIIINVNIHCWFSSSSTIASSWYNTDKVRLSIFDRFLLFETQFSLETEWKSIQKNKPEGGT